MKNLNLKSGVSQTVKEWKVNIKSFWLFWCICFSYRIIKVAANNDTDVAFKSFAPFSTCKTEISDVFVDKENHIYTAMAM